MLSPYDWAEYYLMVSVRNRHQNNGFLLRSVTQGDFLEHWASMWERDIDRRILDLSIVLLTEDSYEKLLPFYEAANILEGD